MTNCLQCSSQTTCTECNSANQYYINSTFKCQTCGVSGCITCASLTTCLTCDDSLNYFIDSNYFCIKCALNQCSDCLSLTQCVTCNANFILDTSQNCVSDCSSLTNCQTCNALGTICASCVTDFILDTSQNCIQSQTYCNSSSDYFLTSQNTCQRCTIPNCLLCLSITKCKTCDSATNYTLSSDGSCNKCILSYNCDGYSLPQYTNSTDSKVYCSTICGDRLVRNFEECDDGNKVDGDGCSSNCTVEKAWSCSSEFSESCCTLEKTEFSLSIKKILKVADRNSITLQLQINPILNFLTDKVLENNVTFKVTGVPLFNESKRILDGQIIQVTYDYAETIQGRTGQIAFQLKFSQPSSPQCIITADKNLTIMTQSNNNLPFMFYTQEQLEKQQEIAQSVQTIQTASFSLFFLSFIPAKINGLQLMGVLQLAYFSLAQQENVNALLEPFMRMNSVNGYNPRILTQIGETLPDQIQALGLEALFLNNCSVMFFLIVTEVILAGVFFNIAFGIALHFNYADKSSDGYFLSSVAAVTAGALVFVPCILLMATESKQFGEFNDKLKPDFVCQIYFVFALFFRFSLGYYAAVKAQYTLSSLIVVGFSILWLSYNFVNLPFRKAYQNYRANVCHIAQFVILMVANYYDSLLSNEPWEKRGHEFRGAEIQIWAIYIAIGVSGVCLVYDIYLFIRRMFCRNTKPKKIANTVPYQKKQIVHITENPLAIQNISFGNMIELQDEINFQPTQEKLTTKINKKKAQQNYSLEKLGQFQNSSKKQVSKKKTGQKSHKKYQV